jgi:hypothetical protein
MVVVVGALRKQMPSPVEPALLNRPVAEGCHAQDELGAPSDFRLLGRFALFRDTELTASICPRPPQFQTFGNDHTSRRDPVGRSHPPLRNSTLEQNSPTVLSSRFSMENKSSITTRPGRLSKTHL